MSIKRNYCYIKVTNDKYRLPIAIADSAGELARIVGATKKYGSIFNITRHRYL